MTEPAGCPLCGGPMVRASRGRPRVVCSEACRSRLYRWRRDRGRLEALAAVNPSIYWDPGQEARRRLAILDALDGGG